jgi:hypothetical protein
MLERIMTSGWSGDVDLELAEHASKARQLLCPEPLSREAQDPVGAERAQNLLEVALRERPAKIDVLDRRAQCAAAGSDVHAMLAIPAAI